jgi:tRNA threonylcarbamoyladenosine biosynthesis protein TsaE
MPTDLLQLRFHLTDIRSAAAGFWNWSRPQRVLCFSGGLGAGKTTFIHALAEVLNITDAVSSPTFALINEYALPAGAGAERVLHMDWYRLRDLDEAINAGMEDALDSRDTICFVEWPEQAPELLSMEHVAVSITIGDTDQERVLDARVVPAS